ncbi:MAG: MFS transporter, partial [Opitutaceae bacterium]
MNPSSQSAAFKPDRLLVAYVFLVFVAISVLTNSLGPLIPDVIGGFHLSLATAGLMPFAFFAAYGAMSIPAGLMIAAWGEKPVILASFLLAAVSCAAFGWLHAYWAALPSLFLIGAGMAALQVAINPLLRVLPQAATRWRRRLRQRPQRLL